MSIDRTIEIFNAAMAHGREMSFLETQRSVGAIDAALAKNTRKGLRAAGFIPKSAADMDRSRGQASRLITETMAQAKALLPGEGLRAFLETPIVQQAFFEAITEKMHLNDQTDRIGDLKRAIIADVHSGKGPLLPETVATLTELRAHILEKGRRVAKANPPLFPEDSDERLFLALITFPITVMMKEASAHQTAQTGVSALVTAPPSDADIQEFASILGEYDEIFQEIVAEIEAEAAEPGAPEEGQPEA